MTIILNILRNTVNNFSAADPEFSEAPIDNVQVYHGPYTTIFSTTLQQLSLMLSIVFLETIHQSSRRIVYDHTSVTTGATTQINDTQVTEYRTTMQRDHASESHSEIIEELTLGLHDSAESL